MPHEVSRLPDVQEGGELHAMLRRHEKALSAPCRGPTDDIGDYKLQRCRREDPRAAGPGG